jgi:hypothetical protein
MIIPKIIAVIKSFRPKSGLNLICGLFLILRPNLSAFLSIQKSFFSLNNPILNCLFNVFPYLRQLMTELASPRYLIFRANPTILKILEIALQTGLFNNLSIELQKSRNPRIHDHELFSQQL